MAKIFMTGSAGLIGRAARARLEAGGVCVAGCDLRAQDPLERFDLRDLPALRRALWGCDGVIHLGGVSRVIDGERRPRWCERVNVAGTEGIVRAVAEARARPWLLYTSSREVYGEPRRLPCGLGAALAPMNVYAKSKLAAEQAVLGLRAAGGAAMVLRFSNVFGAVDDYPDRVVPAFARAAAVGGVLRLEGADNMFDFTALEDAVGAVCMAVEALQAGEHDYPPLDIVTGRGTALRELAEIALAAGNGAAAEVREAPARAFDVARFCGDPAPAARYLGWRAKMRLEQRVARLVGDFRAAGVADART